MNFDYDKFGTFDDTSSKGFQYHLENSKHLLFMNNLLSALLSDTKDAEEVKTQLLTSNVLDAKVKEGSTLSPGHKAAIISLDSLKEFTGTADPLFSNFYDALTNDDAALTEDAAKTFKILQTSINKLLSIPKEKIHEYELKTDAEAKEAAPAVTTPAPAAVTTPAPAVTTPVATATTPAPAVTTPVATATTPAPAVTTPVATATTPAPAVTTPVAVATTPVIGTLLMELHAARNSADKTTVLFRNKDHIKHFSAQEQFQISEQISCDMVNVEVFNYFSDASVKATLSRKEVDYRSGIYF